ncbi:aldehyde dehydrogenase [Rubellicoccus peritrichatus]|uniref:Aldehyde dehydrogenase n=1 Tax=Rubellicoccus peritrichatus TaxID=3080537 RepID=A0AAQ3LAB4_9BACT|nr:aldehyde dehydrogenase [Puniceicoccus sp. CR14]WOO40854.1 aldehyde dehydrogenase [Puniceicoccus sp. CR14]
MEETEALTRYKLFINGEWVDASGSETDEVLNPSTDELIGTIQNGDTSDANKAIQAAHVAQKSWAKFPPIERANRLRAFVAEIKKNKGRLTELLVREQGKLLRVAQMEVDVSCTFIEYACEWARSMDGDIVKSDNPNEHIWIHKNPRGVVVAITAWNFPLALACRKIGPALVAGNTIVVKPTSETPLATLELAELAIKAGIPNGVLNIVTGTGSVMGDALVRHPLTRMVTMTGSTPAGQAIIRATADNMAHVQLELGGKAPFIVFPDADLDLAADAALSSRFDNCGQVCTCNERLYLHESIYESFMEKFLPKVQALKVGDPMDSASDMGPKVNAKEVANMEHLVKTSLEEGAKIAHGGKRPEGLEFEKGNWFEPTILTDVTQDMTIVHEESFGPILPVIKFKSFEEVVTYANDCEYGLAAMVCTKDMKTILRLNNELEFGEIYINRGHGEQHQGFHNGYKMSGTGGEDGKYGFEQYLEKKTFYVNFDS